MRSGVTKARMDVGREVGGAHSVGTGILSEVVWCLMPRVCEARVVAARKGYRLGAAWLKT
jgi:hypothetical protein